MAIPLYPLLRGDTTVFPAKVLGHSHLPNGHIFSGETIDDKRLGLDPNPVPVHLLQSVPNPVVPFAAVISTPPKESLHILSK